MTACLSRDRCQDLPHRVVAPICTPQKIIDTHAARAIRLLSLAKIPAHPIREVSIRARVVREVGDAFDQIRDIANCLDFLEGEPQVDAYRTGFWGSSYGCR